MSSRSPVRVFILGLTIAVSITGCANLFTMNLFSKFDGPPPATDLLRGFDPANPRAFLADLEAAAESERFLTELSQSDRNALNSALRQVYSGSSDPAIVQRAAILAADVSMVGTAAETTVNNLVGAFTSGGDAFGSSESSAGALISSVIPADVLNNDAALTQMLDSMFAAAEAYNALGNSLADSQHVAVSGATAQNAAVSILIYTIAGNPETPNESNEDRRNRLIAAIRQDDFSGLSQPSTALEDGGPLNSILDAAGLGGLF